MIYHKHKLIFTGIPKNASSSVHTILKNLTDPEHHHRSIIDEYNSNDADLMDTYTGFAIVRNPYDRFISACYQIFRDRGVEFEDFTPDFNSIVEDEIKERDNLNEVFIPQYRYIGFGNKILVDNILRYENLVEEYKTFIEEHNKTSIFKIKTQLPLTNQSNDRPSWENGFRSLSVENQTFINDFYHRDFILFNYKKLDPK